MSNRLLKFRSRFKSIYRLLEFLFSHNLFNISPVFLSAPRKYIVNFLFWIPINVHNLFQKINRFSRKFNPKYKERSQGKHNKHKPTNQHNLDDICNYKQTWYTFYTTIPSKYIGINPPNPIYIYRYIFVSSIMCAKYRRLFVCVFLHLGCPNKTHKFTQFHRIASIFPLICQYMYK